MFRKFVIIGSFIAILAVPPGAQLLAYAAADAPLADAAMQGDADAVKLLLKPGCGRQCGARRRLDGASLGGVQERYGSRRAAGGSGRGCTGQDPSGRAHPPAAGRKRRKCRGDRTAARGRGDPNFSDSNGTTPLMYFGGIRRHGCRSGTAGSRRPRRRNRQDERPGPL